ncbi:MAG: cyclopropane-fatty-acyl-phospholipid synthase family protein [Idiomarina sp.]
MPNGESVMTTTNQISWVDKQARSLVLRLLGHLSYGRMVFLEDGSHVATFGQAAAATDLHAEVNVLHPSFYRRMLLGGSIASGELYIDNSWETPDLTAVIQVFARNLPALDAFEAKFTWLTLPFQKIQHWRRSNTKVQAKENISAHYDLGNTLYREFLDSHMQYSSAVYPSPSATLEEAQEHKLKRLCDALELQPSDHLVEIGTGWGGLAVYAALNYGCKVTTTTISSEQHKYATDLVNKLGLQDQVTLLKEDYRDLQGQYDKLVSVEMIEAVGERYLPVFFHTCSRLLKPTGKMAIQAITIADQRMKSYANSVDFIQKHIFPGGFLPSVQLMSTLIAEQTDMVVRQLGDIGLDYAQTLQDWRDRFNAKTDVLAPLGYDDRFSRLWNFYLSYCEGGFRERTISAVQFVATKPGCRAFQHSGSLC